MQLFSSDANLHKSPEQLRREKLEVKIKTVKADHAPGVVKYLMYQKNTDKIQSPLHNVEYHHPKFKPQFSFPKTLQKVDVEPQVQLDEIREERWNILSKNCQNILEKSKVSLGKLNDSQQMRYSSLELYPKTVISAKNKFLSRRQSIELRIENIKSPIASPITVPLISPETKNTDSHFNKFKKFYKKIGIPKLEEEQHGYHYFRKIQKHQESADKMFHLTSLYRQNQSSVILQKTINQQQCQQYHVVLPQQKKSNHQYLQQLLTLCSNAHNFQEEMKKDESNNYGDISQKVSFIQSEFKKYHQMLSYEQESMENIDIK